MVSVHQTLLSTVANKSEARIIRGRLFRNGLCGRRRLQGLCPRAPRIYRLVPLPMLGSLQETDEKGDAEASPYRSVEATESALGLLPSIALSSAQFGLILLRRDKEAHLSVFATLAVNYVLQGVYRLLLYGIFGSKSLKASESIAA